MASSVGPVFVGGSGAAWAEIAHRDKNPAQVERVIRIILSASNVLPLHNTENPSRRRIKICQEARGLVCRANAKFPRAEGRMTPSASVSAPSRLTPLERK